MAIRLRNLIVAALVAIAVPAFAQNPPSDLPVPPFTTWDPTNGLGTLNDWVVNKLNPNLPTGGGGGSGGKTSYPTHALLIANAVVPSAGPTTISQQGFYASGDGGVATYNWNSTSYCSGGTMLSPVTADGIVCILPSGQSASTAGRYLLQTNGTIDPRSVGMAAGGVDNAPFIPSLMNLLSTPSSFSGGSPVVFPAIPGQGFTNYYFANPLILTQGATYSCGGSGKQAFAPAVSLVFAPGMDGVIQAYNGGVTYGGGSFSGCNIVSLGVGSANAVESATTVTSVVMTTGPGAAFPASVWNPGDGIFITPFFGAFGGPDNFINGAITGSPRADSVLPAVLPGAFISGASGSTLTLGGGYTINTGLTTAFATFVQIGTNNFVAGDTITAGNNTFTFVSTIGAAAGNVLTGVNYAASSANLIASIMGTAGSGTTYITPTNVPNITASLLSGDITFKSTTSGVSGNALTSTYTPTGTAAGAFDFTFAAASDTSNFAAGDSLTIGNNTYQFVSTIGSTPGNVLRGSNFLTSSTNLNASINSGAGCVNTATYICATNTPNVAAEPNSVGGSVGRFTIEPLASGISTPTYTPFSVSAGSFIASSTFASGDSITNMELWQLPASRAFSVTTTSGSNSITVTAGPRLPRSGDILWSDAFPFGSIIRTVTGTSFPVTALVFDAHEIFGINATTNHLAGSGQFWVLPAGFKREVQGMSDNNRETGWIVGFLEACSVAGSMNCTSSVDRDNLQIVDYIGQWIAGDNTAPRSSLQEEGAKNFFADVLEGGALGSAYWDFNSNSAENGEAKYSVIGNCLNQNYGSWYGGYIANGNQFGFCDTPNTGLVPVTKGGTQTFYSPTNATPGGSTEFLLAGSAIRPGGGVQWLSGPVGTYTANLSNCIEFGGPTTYFALAWSNAGCGTPSNFAWAWNSTVNAWDVLHSSTDVIMRYAAANNNPGPYTGYSGPNADGSIVFNKGFALYNAADFTHWNTGPRWLEGKTSVPINTGHLEGDIALNDGPAVGENFAWIDTPIFTTTLTAAVTKAVTTTVTITACPTVTPPAGTPVVSTTLAPHLLLGTFSSCSAGTLTFQAVAANSSSGTTDAVEFLQWQPAGIIQDSIPAISSCGTGTPTVTAGSTNLAGQFTMGTGTPTACTITFAHAYPTAAFCTVTPASSGGAAITGGDYLSAMSKSGFTWTLGTGTSSLVFDYTCAGN